MLAKDKDTSHGRAKRCVIPFLTGGPPQHDTFDPKPDAPADLTATLLHLLGVPPDIEIHDAAGRPHRACTGTPVRGLLD